MTVTSLGSCPFPDLRIMDDETEGVLLVLKRSVSSFQGRQLRLQL
jgi:hypothetical protein